MTELPFIPGFLIVLVISIIVTRIYMKIAGNIGEGIRIFFTDLCQRNKK